MYPLNWPLSRFLYLLGISISIKVEVRFDDDAKVYVATSKTVRGLTVEADTLDNIRSEVEMVLPELLTLNHFDNKPYGNKRTYSVIIKHIYNLIPLNTPINAA